MPNLPLYRKVLLFVSGLLVWNLAVSVVAFGQDGTISRAPTTTHIDARDILQSGSEPGPYFRR